MRKANRFLISLCIVFSFVFVVPAITTARIPTVAKVDAATDEKVYTYENTVALDTRTNSWHYFVHIENPLSKKLTLMSLVITDIRDGNAVGEYRLKASELDFTSKTIASKGSWYRLDNHPYTTNFNRREYRFTCKTSDGSTVIFSYMYTMTESGKSVFANEKKSSSVYTHNLTTTYDEKGRAWHYKLKIKNPLSKKVKITGYTILDTYDGIIIGSDMLNLKEVGMNNKTIKAKGTLSETDNHPYTDMFNGREYRFECVTDSGKKIIIKFIFKMKGGPKIVDSKKDLITLRHKADFKVKVGDGVYWVPAVKLGKSSYTNGQIRKMLDLTPEEKQAKIDTLYEAIQLYEVGNFGEDNDNVRIFENGISWEHHKPGYYAVISNRGCCATDSAWLSYMLRGDYDDIGYIQISETNGSGHVINYIKKGSWYYTIDMTHYRNDFMCSAFETGKKVDYNDSDIVLGNVHAVKNLKDYAKYFIKHGDKKTGLIIKEKMQDVPAIDSVASDGYMIITYGSDQKDKLTVLYDNKKDKLELGFATPPTKLPDWAALCR